MEKGRKKSKGRDTSTSSKSPVKGKRKTAKGTSETQPRAASRSRSRGRPRKSEASTKRPPSRSRSRSSNRAVPSPRQNKTTEPKQPALVLRDIYNENSTVRQELNDLIRRSLSKDIDKNESNTITTRRSGRLTLKTSQTWHSDNKSKIQPSESTSKKTTTEFGGWLGALIHLIVFPVFSLALILGCSREQCSLQPFHIPRNPRYYLNWDALIGVVGFLLLQTLLTLLPIGRLVKQPSYFSTNISYRCNGVLSAILTTSLLGGLWYYKTLPVTLAYDRHVSLAVTAYLLSLIISVFLYVKANYVSLSQLNPYGNTGNRIYDFFVGREINPILFNHINVKILLMRFCFIGIISLNLLLALKAYEIRKELPPTLGVSIGLFAFYLLDFLWFEESFTYTFEATSEGLGALETTMMLTGPFLATIIPRFILHHRIELPIYSLVFSSVAFVIGYFIYRASNLQKAAFRRNPLDKAFHGFKTISTNRGKKLLVSGWWGLVKHPNYLGDIILNWAWATTTGFSHVIPYVLPITTTVFLLHRAARDDARCRTRYQNAWEEYSERVPKRVIPAIY